MVVPLRWLLLSVATLTAASLGIVHARGQQQPPPTFKSGVDLVVLDVSVVATSGVPVSDLAPGDFTVLVDGRPRRVASAQFLSYASRTTATREPSTAVVPGVSLAAPAPPRILLVAVDEDSLETGEGLVAKQAASKFLDRLGPNDRAGVVTIPRLRSPVQVSTKRSDAKKALDAIIPGINRDPYEFNIGLSEALDIERGFTDVLARVARREYRLPEDVPFEKIPAPGLIAIKMQCRQMVLQTKLRTQRSLDALALLADALTGVDGPKTVVLISGGLTMPDESPGAAYSRLEGAFGAAQITLYTVFLERSSLFGQVKYTPSPSAMDDDRLEMAGIENATSAVGGTLMLGIGTLDQYFDRVITELSGSYLLGIDVAAADRDGRPHLVDVKVNRPGLEVRARKRYVIEPPRTARTEAVAPPKPRKDNRPVPPPPITLEMMTPEVEAVVARAGAYAGAYETALSALVAEERYAQRAFKAERRNVTVTRETRSGRVSTTEVEEQWLPDGERELKSDFLLVKAQGGDRWLPFRDVFEVDGKAVRTREERLQKLFLEAPATAAERAAAITAESARYNIGYVERNLNLPTLPLRLLDPSRRAQMLFRKERETKIAGVTTWELAFAERGSPTIVRDGGKDIPATGIFWIDPVSGRVLRTTMRFEMNRVMAEMTVTYQPAAKAGETWVPAEMREMYQSSVRRLECVATYSKIRRFQVTTDEVQKGK
jgi:VWFA-related protein